MNGELYDKLIFESGVSQSTYHDPNHPDICGYVVTDEKVEKLIAMTIEKCVSILEQKKKFYLEAEDAEEDENDCYFRSINDVRTSLLGDVVSDIKEHFEVES